jgi:hypothetical protein
MEIFISHAHKDAKLAEALVDFLVTGLELRPKEIRCTSHLESSLPGGAKINFQLRNDIENCRLFLPLITKNAVASQFVSFEIGAAWALKARIIPLVYGIKPASMPQLLSDLVCTDLAKYDSLLKLGKDLAEAIYIRDRQNRIEEENNRIAAVATKFLTQQRRRGPL